MSHATAIRYSRASSRPADDARLRQLVVYRGGLQLRDSPLWFDAPRPRDVCFLSHSWVKGWEQHRRVLASTTTAELLSASARRRRRRRPLPQVLAVPFGQRFALGQLDLELFPVGSAPGAAAVRVLWHGDSIVYAGSLSAGSLSAGSLSAGSLSAGSLSGSATLISSGYESRPADILVLAGAALDPLPADAPAALDQASSLQLVLDFVDACGPRLVVIGGADRHEIRETLCNAGYAVQCCAPREQLPLFG